VYLPPKRKGSTPSILEKSLKTNYLSQVWWFSPLIPALRRLRQEELEINDRVVLYKKTISKKKREEKTKERKIFIAISNIDDFSG
jgi:hypothetical protein